ncbi:MAG: Zn-dependent alcohol dehydrogenase [Alphaproteobacteria bacterium]|nr:Zn-dependent alcohol dehydrogenase [Alphaproteobacteria bacterium]
MKAAICRAFGQPLTIEEVEIAPPGPGEVKVKLAACAICHSDIHYADGAWGGDLPAVYGHEAAGVIDVVGAGVDRVEAGDPVIVTLLRACGACPACAQDAPYLCDGDLALDARSPLTASNGEAIDQGMQTGAFAEYVTVDQSQIEPVPDDMPLDSAALLACGVITGFGAVVNTARVPAGSSVVVIGTGGVGLNAVQGAALSGGDPIIAIDLAADKLVAAIAFGASHAIDAANQDAAARVRELTQGRGADYVFVTVGSKAAMEQGLGLLRRAGTLVVVGMPASGVKLEIEAADFAFDGQRILGSNMGSTRLRTDIPKLIALYRDGSLKLDELISGRYRLDQINEAIAAVKRGEALRNVIEF